MASVPEGARAQTLQEVMIRLQRFATLYLNIEMFSSDPNNTFVRIIPLSCNTRL